MSEPAPRASATVTDVLLEGEFPFAGLAALSQADHRLSDPVYASHKWWARRPRSVIRALILAAHLPASTSADEFWKLFSSDEPLLKGKLVGDPFSGGATTLVEGARLGASVSGSDVDPLAVRIAVDELATVNEEAEAEAAERLLAEVDRLLALLYPSPEPSAQPLHYFWLRRARCSTCRHSTLLYRSLLLARDVGRSGAVVRDGRQEAFCPECRRLHRPGAKATTMVCCRRRWELSKSTSGRAGFCCPACSAKATLSDLEVASLPEELIAVEETVDGGRRRFREPNAEDLRAIRNAASRRRHIEDQLPTDSLDGVDGGRPASYGFSQIKDLFRDRQCLVLANAFKCLEAIDADAAVKARLALAISNSISSNNRLCGYARDYGRLAPAFTGVRSYSVPTLSVELNPLHPSAGRGTVPATLRRLKRSAAATVNRVTSPSGEAMEMVGRRKVAHRVALRSADRPFDSGLGDCSAIITDPPYFDYIAYSDLSLLHRAWLERGRSNLGGAPIYPVEGDENQTLIKRLATAFSNVAASLRPAGVLVFTYHSTNPAAWEAVGEAVARAELKVTAAFPVWADARSSGAHGHPGSCEWDLVWVCRRAALTVRAPASTAAWLCQLPDLNAADRRSLELGLGAVHAANQGLNPPARLVKPA